MDFESFVLAAVTADLDAEPAAREHADCVEFRMDLAEQPLDALGRYDGELPLLVTNRVAGEGGETPEGPDRLDALETAVQYGHVAAVDIELEAIQAQQQSGADGVGGAGFQNCDPTRVIETAREQGVSVIVSTHDFEGTPNPGELRELLRQAAEFGDVAKLAVTATTRGEVLDLLSVTHELSAAGMRVATMAMGEPGRHSRAVAPLYGSRIGYAPIESENATAPGQYALATLRSLVDHLESM